VSRYGVRAPDFSVTEPSVFELYSPEGDFLGRLPVPENASVVGSRNKKVWLIHTDDVGVQRLVRYAVYTDPQSPAAEYWR
jgi:hypothetical protein